MSNDYRELIPENLYHKDRNLWAWMCTYTPEELIIAAGFSPYRLYGVPDSRRADSYLPINFCPYIKANLSQLLLEADRLQGVVIANSCDGSRRLYDAIEAYLPQLPSFFLDIPRLAGADSISFYQTLLKKFLNMLENISGNQADDKRLSEAIAVVNEKKKGLRQLRQAYREQRLSLNHYYQLVRGSAVIHPQFFNPWLKDFLADLPATVKKPGTGPRIMLIGNFISQDQWWNILSDLDCQLVYDDVCTLSRYFDLEVTDYRQQPFYALARAYLQKPLCMRMADLGTKVDSLKQAIDDFGVQAIIFVSLKFCDNTLYFYPLAKQNLGLPILNLELEFNNFPEGQIRTRLEAFLEML